MQSELYSITIKLNTITSRVYMKCPYKETEITLNAVETIKTKQKVIHVCIEKEKTMQCHANKKKMSYISRMLKSQNVSLN